MWNRFCMFFTIIFLQNYVNSKECVTQSGMRGLCVSQHECPDHPTTYNEPPVNNVLNFLKQSSCDVIGSDSKICCITIEQNFISSVKSATSHVNKPRQVDHTEKYFDQEDASTASLDTCGIENLEQRIYGGRFTEVNEFPWMALLKYRTGSGSIKYMCGGALINRWYVLTAAHCLTGEILNGNTSLVTAHLGEYDTSNESGKDCRYDICADLPQEIPVAAVYPHPKYNAADPNRQHDIGIIKLAKKVEYTDYVQPICLARNKNSLNDGEVVYFSGWGRTLEAPRSPMKRMVKMPIFNRDKCKEIYKRKPKTAFLGSSQICAGGLFKEGTCQGDSGGPLMKRNSEGVWEAVGVSSFGRGCGLEGYPGVYTSVADYYSWIKSTLNQSLLSH